MARNAFQLFYITDRTQLKCSLEETLAQAIDAGVDGVQIREKDLAARRLLTITQAAVVRARHKGSTRIMVNDRVDVALAAGAHGVHLSTRSLPVNEARRITPEGFIIGMSCHSLAEARAAELAGADYILLGPIFSTPSKLQYGAPLGLSTLREVTSKVSIPVFALGGISLDRVAECRENGAAGIAGIRLFQDAASMFELVRVLREKSQ
jgi:thiamine-phosphate pyrophosphorylase